jgi:hypothetical protein
MRLIKWPGFGEGERRREWGKEKIRILYLPFKKKITLLFVVDKISYYNPNFLL